MTSRASRPLLPPPSSFQTPPQPHGAALTIAGTVMIAACALSAITIGTVAVIRSRSRSPAAFATSRAPGAAAPSLTGTSALDPPDPGPIVVPIPLTPPAPPEEPPARVEAPPSASSPASGPDQGSSRPRGGRSTPAALSWDDAPGGGPRAPVNAPKQPGPLDWDDPTSAPPGTR